MTTGNSSSGAVVWLTGLSSAGKTTLAHATAAQLAAWGYRVEVLDGDDIRKHICHGLGFSREDRDENVRRAAYVASLLAKHGVIVLVAVIAPYREARGQVRECAPHFIEVFVNAPLAVCELRDVKGLYARARRGEIRHFTGIDDPYEPPLAPDVECRTDVEAVDACANRILNALRTRHLLHPRSQDQND